MEMQPLFVFMSQDNQIKLTNTKFNIGNKIKFDIFLQKCKTILIVELLYL